MKSLIPLLVLSFIAPSALAGGLKDERLDSATFCGDPVIRHLDRGIFFNESRDCCVFGDPWIAAKVSSTWALQVLPPCHTWGRAEASGLAFHLRYKCQEPPRVVVHDLPQHLIARAPAFFSLGTKRVSVLA